MPRPSVYNFTLYMEIISLLDFLINLYQIPAHVPQKCWFAFLVCVWESYEFASFFQIVFVVVNYNIGEIQCWVFKLFYIRKFKRLLICLFTVWCFTNMVASMSMCFPQCFWMVWFPSFRKFTCFTLKFNNICGYVCAKKILVFLTFLLFFTFC